MIARDRAVKDHAVSGFGSNNAKKVSANIEELLRAGKLASAAGIRALLHKDEEAVMLLVLQLLKRIAELESQSNGKSVSPSPQNTAFTHSCTTRSTASALPGKTWRTTSPHRFLFRRRDAPATQAGDL